MAGISIVWNPGPGAIAAAIGAKVAATKAGLADLAQTHAARGEEQMKANAPWSDRTGNARQGLTGRADDLTITLAHTMDYGVYLENGTSKMSAYPIVQPTAQTVASAYVADAVQFVRGLWG